MTDSYVTKKFIRFLKENNAYPLFQIRARFSYKTLCSLNNKFLSLYPKRTFSEDIYWANIQALWNRIKYIDN